MSDRLPPDGGPDPYDGWDPEGLLSGESVWLPDGMRPVAGTLAALRGAPMRAELAGEASARAAFREIMLAGERGPGWSGRAVGGGDTLILPTRSSGGGPHVVTRPRHSHRRPPRRRHWQSKAVAGAAAGAAAVMIVGGIALAGGFSGAAAHPGQPGPSASATTRRRRRRQLRVARSRGDRDEGAHRPPDSQRLRWAVRRHGLGGMLCRQYWTFFRHPESPADWAAENGQLPAAERAGRQPLEHPPLLHGLLLVGVRAAGALVPDLGDGQGGPGLQVPGDSQGERPATFRQREPWQR